MAETVLLLRFDEVADATRPTDAAGNLAELEPDDDTTMPAIVDAVLGRGRQFAPADITGLVAQDVVPGSTLLTRDCSIQVWLAWDFAAQAADAGLASVYARGLGTGAAEYIGAGLQLRVVNEAQNIGEVRWIWQDLAGVTRTQIGAHFRPSSSGVVMLTATRRWVSSTEVVLRYYLGDRLLGEVVSADGSIGGGTTGTTTIGTRFVGGDFGEFLAGVLDELRVVDYELTAEEIAETWRRITVHQPNGYRLVYELHDPGFPISRDPASRVQKETRMWGNAIGFASAQAENLRNIIPTRAYGQPLEDWETVLKQAPKPGDSVETRRARVVARERRAADGLGVSIPGIEAALRELVDTDPANLEILAFDQTITDAFTTLDAQRWLANPLADWSIASNSLRVVATSAEDLRVGGGLTGWKTCQTPIGGNGGSAHILAKLTPTDFGASGAVDVEAGVFLADFTKGNAILLGLRRTAGSTDLRIWTESFRAWASQGETMRENLVSPAAVWLHLHGASGSGFGGAGNSSFTGEWSTTGPLTGYSAAAPIVNPATNHWAGFYLRSIGAATSDDAEVRFDDAIVRAPLGTRSFMLYVYRNPALPGRPDLVGANHIIRQLKHGHTHAAVITNKQTLYDDPTTPYDLGPMGAL